MVNRPIRSASQTWASRPKAMAKLRGGNGIGGVRTNALGPAYVIAEWRGVPVVRLKKHRKKHVMTERQAEAVQQFRYLANVPKLIASSQIQAAMDMSHGTPYLWRDLIYMATAGRLGWFTDDQNRKVFSLAARTTTSDILDVISQIPGSMLYRTGEWWDVVLPGNPGDVLTFTDADQVPSWQPGGAGGGIANVATTVNTGTSPGSSAFKGNDVTANQDITHHGAQVLLWAPATQEFQVQLATWDGTTIGTVLAVSSTFINAGTGNDRRMYEFPTPVTVPAGTRVILCVGIINKTATTICSPAWSAYNVSGYPFAFDNVAARFNVTTLAPGVVSAQNYPQQNSIAPWWS